MRKEQRKGEWCLEHKDEVAVSEQEGSVVCDQRERQREAGLRSRVTGLNKAFVRVVDAAHSSAHPYPHTETYTHTHSLYPTRPPPAALVFIQDASALCLVCGSSYD